MLVLPLLSLLGCTPQDADVKGEYFVWLAANSSSTVSEGLVNLDGATHIECLRGWNDEEEDWDLGYIGPRQGEVKAGGDWSDTYIGGDCAPTDADCLAVIDELQAPCEQIDDMKMHQFLQKDGFYAYRETLDPWRTEVVLNSEGDFQLTFHHHLDGGEDFRVAFAVAPDFAPIECTTDEKGNTVASYVDGDVWLDQWSADLEHQAARMQVTPASQGDELLGHGAQGLGLGVRGLDALVHEQRGGHVLEHGFAVFAGPGEFSSCSLVTHGRSYVFCRGFTRTRCRWRGTPG
jgi:hypothetical protein